MVEGLITKSLSGFYTVTAPEGEFICKARGKFRRDGESPLVGDKVIIAEDGNEGLIREILPRRNWFIRPNVSNVDQMIVFASATIPITDPFLIDRIAAIAVIQNCEPIIVFNKCDVDTADELFSKYEKSGFRIIRTSAVDGRGVDELRDALRGKISVFTGNSGVGKSSVLNRISEDLNIKTGEISEKLGRGRHTTRHIELYRLENDTYIIDTPGFSYFDTDILNCTNASQIADAFREFEPYKDTCRFLDCTHTRERGCSVIEAVNNGEISASRHASFIRLYDMAKSVKEWEIKK